MSPRPEQAPFPGPIRPVLKDCKSTHIGVTDQQFSIYIYILYFIFLRAYVHQPILDVPVLFVLEIRMFHPIHNCVTTRLLTLLFLFAVSELFRHPSTMKPFQLFIGHHAVFAPSLTCQLPTRIGHQTGIHPVFTTG